MIGLHATDDAIVMSNGEQTGESDTNWIQWLLFTHLTDDKIAYDLDYLVAKVIAHSNMGEHRCNRLLTEHRAFTNDGYRIFYIPNRVLSIDYGHGAANAYCNVYNAKQFMSDVRHSPGISIDTARQNAATAQGIGQNVLDAYAAIGIDNKSLSSPIKAYDKAGLWPNAITVDDIPGEAHELAYLCIKSNWVEAYQIGHWNMAYDYDINGAYASELAMLKDLRLGTWEKASKIPSGAVYGFAECMVEIAAPFHPIIMRGRNDNLYTPTGTWSAYLTLQEIGFIERYHLGHVRVHNGWWWIPEQVTYPFNRPILLLWEARRKNAGTMVDTVCKRIMAGMWGKMLELRGSEAEPEFGPHFNPVYGAVVETNIRLRVAQTCIDNGVVPLHIAVDGMITDKPLRDVKVGEYLGQWRLSHSGPCIIAGSGIVGMSGKAGDEEFALSYEWLRGMMQVYPDASEYEKKKWSTITVAKALSNKQWDRLGQLEEITRTVRIGEDGKRVYADGPKCGGDILVNQYQSQPWSSGIVEAK